MVEQEKEVLEEKEVAMTGEGQIYRDNRSCSPSLSRGRRVSVSICMFVVIYKIYLLLPLLSFVLRFSRDFHYT